MNSTDYKERTLFVSNVDPQVTEGLLYELFLQAGPLCKVVIPKSKPGVRSLKAFITFKHMESTPYALAMLHGILLFGKPLQLKFYRGVSPCFVMGRLARSADVNHTVPNALLVCPEFSGGI
ncbi:unnamed protein product [Lampetra planeri]